MAILTNKKWQAYEDAETLARYQDIMDDPKRKRAAILEAKNKAKDFPEIVEGSVMSIMPKSSAHLAEASASIAIYEMPCSLLYWRYE